MIALKGYVTIENRTDGAVFVIGKTWTLDYVLAKQAAGREGGLVASRNWITNKLLADPVIKFDLVEAFAAPTKPRIKNGGVK